MFKALRVCSPALSVVLVLAATVAGQEAPRTPLLMLDVKAESQKEPYYFRTTKDPFKEAARKPPSRQGLDTLNASGSASFSDESLAKIRKKLGDRKITVVDLRQESHGFLNGLSIVWWGERNASNRGKTLAQVVKDEEQRLAALKKENKATINRLVIDDPKNTFQLKDTFTLPVRSIQSEAELCRTQDLGYFRIPVTDRDRPTDEEVDRFVRFVRELPNETWLHFHCKAGHGRTTSFLAMYDMMRNAKTVSLDDIIQRQSLLGGNDLFADPAKDDWRYPGAIERRKFLEKFYRYCKANDDGFRTSWSEWLARQSK